jgi:L-rhamnose mutarotase
VEESVLSDAAGAQAGFHAGLRFERKRRCFQSEGASHGFTQFQEHMMKRNAFAMQLKPGNEAEYKRRHDQIWPELKAELRKAGVSDYSIYLDPETLRLFAIQSLADDETSSMLPQSPIVRTWWDSMKDLMETNPDNSPKVWSLIEMFHMD